MLRHGSAELDERHAELAALAPDLRARDEELRAEERDIAVRKQELGAVELRRAAVERREQAAHGARARRSSSRRRAPQNASSASRRGELRRRRARWRRVGRPAKHPAATRSTATFSMSSDGGYRIVERDEPPTRRARSSSSTGRRTSSRASAARPSRVIAAPCAYLDHAEPDRAPRRERPAASVGLAASRRAGGRPAGAASAPRAPPSDSILRLPG